MVNKFSKIATAVALTIALTAPMIVSATTVDGSDTASMMKKSQEIMKENKENKMMETKQKHEAKVAQTAAVKACVSTNYKTRNTALNDAWKAYLAATKDARTARAAAYKAAQDTYKASAKDAAARTARKEARKAAQEAFKVATKDATTALKTARTAARDAYKAAVATCKTAQ